MFITKMVKAAYSTSAPGGYNYDSDQATVGSCDTLSKWWPKTVWPFIILALVSWMGFAFCPSKKDSLIIVTGGAVGNFVTKDSSAKAIPAEAMTLLRDKIKQEIRELNTTTVTKKLEDMTKEELLEQLKAKQ
jgi:hypothetical protein